MTKNSYSPNLFQRISHTNERESINDCVQEEVMQLLRHAARSGRTGIQQGEDQAWSSTLNYGIPMASFCNNSLSDVEAVIRHLKQMIPVFEPRIDSKTLQITAAVSEGQRFRESVMFDISAGTRGISTGYISFRVAVDFSNGAVHLVRRPNL